MPKAPNLCPTDVTSKLNEQYISQVNRNSCLLSPTRRSCKITSCSFAQYLYQVKKNLLLYIANNVAKYTRMGLSAYLVYFCLFK